MDALAPRIMELIHAFGDAADDVGAVYAHPVCTKLERNAASKRMVEARHALREAVELLAKDRDNWQRAADSRMNDIHQAKGTIATLRKSLGQAADELYGDPEARIGGWKERAVAAEQCIAPLRELVGLWEIAPVLPGTAGKALALPMECDELNRARAALAAASS